MGQNNICRPAFIA